MACAPALDLTTLFEVISQRVERLMRVAGACSPVDQMCVTAMSGVTTLVMAENHTKTKEQWGAVPSRMLL